VIGIFVGVGLSGRGFVNDAERKNFEARIDELRADRDYAVARAARRAAARRCARRTSPTRRTRASVRRRLAGTKVGSCFVGSVDQGLAGTIRRTVSDAGGRIVRMRALRVPLDPEAVDQRSGATRHARPRRADSRSRLGTTIARELVAGGQTPVLDRSPRCSSRSSSGSRKAPLDAVVVARPARPQQGETRTSSRASTPASRSASVPSVGVEESRRAAERGAAVPRGRLATVDAVDTAVGQVALVFLLEGARPGSYGTRHGRRRRRPARRAASGARRVSEPDGARRRARRGGADRRTVRRCASVPGAEVVVADDGSRDATAPRRGGRAPASSVCRAAARARRSRSPSECRAGPLLLCDADLDGDLRPLVERTPTLAVARFARRVGGGLGLAKGVARPLVSADRRRVAEPLSGPAALSRARARGSSRSRRASASRRG
jgi:hypothetical protein